MQGLFFSNYGEFVAAEIETNDELGQSFYNHLKQAPMQIKIRQLTEVKSLEPYALSYLCWISRKVPGRLSVQLVYKRIKELERMITSEFYVMLLPNVIQ